METHGAQAWYFKSLERGAYSLLSATHGIGALEAFTQRVLQTQEPAVGWVGDLNQAPAGNGIPAIRDGRKTTMMGIPTETDLLDTETNRVPDEIKTAQDIRENHVNMVLEHSLGYGNESVGALFQRPFDDPTPADAPTQGAIGAPRLYDLRDEDNDVTDDLAVKSTYPWLAWGNRPYISAEELLNVPGTSSALMLRQFSTITGTAGNPYDGTGIADPNNTPADPTDDVPMTVAQRWAKFVSPFGHLFSFFQTANTPADVWRDAAGDPEPDAKGNWQYLGAPHFYRILEYVQVPSRYVGTETMLTAEIFNDVPAVADAVGADIASPQDPRYNFQPPFNNVSRERDPGQVNLNTVTGRRAIDSVTGNPRIWSEVYDGIMHRDRDQNQLDRASHLGPRLAGRGSQSSWLPAV
jgi:hypothetical protein